MWLVIASLAIYQYQREKGIRERAIRNQLDIINMNIIDAYENNVDIVQYVKFNNDFFDNTIYNGVRISVYSYDGMLIASCGEVIPFKYHDNSFEDPDHPTHNIDVDFRLDKKTSRHDKLFYYVARTSFDGKFYVLTAMPFTESLNLGLNQNAGFWWAVVALALIASALVYWLINHTSRSVRLLATFAKDVADGRSFDHNEEFPHDEFGQISRKLIELYNAKDAAMKENEQEHRVAMNAIIEKQKLKREMSNNISHELKTPVGIIKGYVDTVMSDDSMDADTMRYFIGRAQPNVDRLCQLLEDLSTVTRIEDGVKQITFEKVDYHDLVYTVANDFKIASKDSGIQFKFNIPLNTFVRGNYNLLTAMLQNLARNSKRHSQGSLIMVEHVGESERFHTFRYYDNGIGVPEESIPRLFDRFYRVDKGRSRKLGDSGLGLTIVQSTIISMGGAISAKNRSTGGLEFIYTLPKWDAPAPHPTEGAPAPDNG